MRTHTSPHLSHTYTSTIPQPNTLNKLLASLPTNQSFSPGRGVAHVCRRCVHTVCEPCCCDILFGRTSQVFMRESLFLEVKLQGLLLFLR